MGLNIPSLNLSRIVIVGGGFAGLELANKLSKSAYQIVVIDKNNYHQFQPLLYQVATAGLEPSSISFPYRKLFQGNKNTHFRLTKVEKIRPIDKVIETSLGELEYDFLIISTGAGNNFFGNERIKELSLPMKSITEALFLRNTLFQRFENAMTAESEVERAALLNIAIVGGGPTGVEVAGALAEMRNRILPKDYPEMDFSKMRIVLIQGDGRLLSSMSEKSSKVTDAYLREMGVELHYNARVVDYDGTLIYLKDEEPILSKSLIWAAGIIGNRIEGLSETSYGPGGRILVDEFNRCHEYPEIFVIGDVAGVQGNPKYPNGYPQMAQPAIQQGKNLAKNLIGLLTNKAMKPFKYKDLGSMATVGRAKAVVELPRGKFYGFYAWLLWLIVHLRSILGVKNRFIILLNWIWNYFTYNLSLRLIIKSKD